MASASVAPFAVSGTRGTPVKSGKPGKPGKPGISAAPARQRKESLADVLRRRSSVGAVERQERTAAVALSLAALAAGGQAPTKKASALSGSLADESLVHVL